MTLLGNVTPDSDLRDKLGKSVFIIDNDDNMHSWFSTRLMHKFSNWITLRNSVTRIKNYL